MKFNAKKDWYKSKTVWAAAATFGVAIVSAAFGEGSVITIVVIGALSALGIYGRVTAESEIKK